MIQFTRLRLQGFKSFVEPTDLIIEPGMTGVVGPNGCGKSNLVEALRWVMGETSARQMRGSEMDDVIFGGTSNRPARNVAEVSLHLDNSMRTAPAIFNQIDMLEITRRIDRGKGSLYKVNSKEVRARDVTLVFADAATGARSTAMVSQGRVGALINAKPAERRSLLEEAAGISGLHSRRNEAELRLKAAETNLARLDDVLITLDTQLQGLRKQARQASRYRNVAEQIRAVEARLLALRWLAALEAHDDARKGLKSGDGEVVELTALAAQAATQQAEAAAGLPALRNAEAEAGAKLQRLIAAREQLDAEENRLAQAARDSRQRLEQAEADIAREHARRQDAEQALENLAAEKLEIEDQTEGEVVAEESARERLTAATAEIDRLDAGLAALTEQVAAAEARRAALARQVAELSVRRQKLGERTRDAETQLESARNDAVDAEDLAEAEMRLETAIEQAEQARLAVETSEARKAEAAAARDRMRDALQGESAARARLKAEADALRDVLAQGRSGRHPPVLDAISVTPGYEAALGAAMGDDLDHPADDATADTHWSTLAPLSPPPALPAGTESLSGFVTAPPALARRLSQIAVAASAELADGLRFDLKPGQRLVTIEGGLWRWDGLVMAAGAPTAAAIRLKQRNRLRQLDEAIEEADLRVDEAETRVETASETLIEAAEAERQARDGVRAADQSVAQNRDLHSKLAQKAAAAASRLAALQDTLDRAQSDLAEAEAQEVDAREAMEAQTDGSEARDKVAALRAELAERRSGVVEARSLLDRLIRESGDRRRRLAAIATEDASWRDRAQAAGRHVADLEERRDQAVEEIERLAAAPLEIAEKRSHLLDDIQAADEARAQAAQARVEAETWLTEIDRRLKDAEKALAAAREDRIRREAALDAAAATCRAVAGRIAERLECTPEQLLAERAEDDQPPVPLDQLETKLDRLTRERDSIGPVNLRAEQEVAEMEEQIHTLQTEKLDLIEAIAKLRRGISELNREARERLNASFEEVDRHFRDLFVRLFGGGRAHLTLTESDDPLAAGLEIMASPPGKRLQVLSLLSGGEQALTALALLFAVFMTNPAPICVLDEVDAPLDDANVDRFCTLVEEIARTSKTRFLVITHHRMTMARVDRLFGVTMAERGVSQLVSVDLSRAEELVEPV